MAESEQSRRIALIVNTRSRSGRRDFGRARRRLREMGAGLALARAVRDPRQLGGTVAEALAAGCNLIIVGGGDGTVSAAASQLANRNEALAILPLGTANSFARGAGIPLELDEAVRTALGGRVERVALGRVGERYFVNGIALGLPVQLSEATPHWFKRIAGPLSYPLVGLPRLARSAGFRCRLVSDGDTFETHAVDLRIANGGYQGGMLVAEGAEIGSADLLVRVVTGRSAWPLVRAWLGWLTGREADESDVRSWRACDVFIRTRPRQSVAADGEVIGQTPLRVQVAPGALRLVRPPAVTASGGASD
jgi:YegS/Rv2252/BmrU family lipid kinase